MMYMYKHTRAICLAGRLVQHEMAVCFRVKVKSVTCFKCVGTSFVWVRSVVRFDKVVWLQLKSYMYMYMYWSANCFSPKFHDVRVKVSSFSYIVAHVLIVPVPPFNALAGTLLSE